jgi:proteasome lid subunit RPN8/RPN11
MLEIAAGALADLIGHAYDCYPWESCGLLAGRAGRSRAEVYYPCVNAAASARVYTIDAGDHFRAERDAERRGLEIIGVVHSHTHTEPYPSPTDVAQAIDPLWSYVIVSLKRDAPEVRCFRIDEGREADAQIDERQIAVG